MMGINTVLALLLVTSQLCFSSLDAAATPKRVRKEIRTLSGKDLNRYKRALHTMLTVPTAIGQMAYGSKYKDYRYFLLKHAAAAYDPRNDQAHFSVALMTYHRCWTLELEESILAIEPKLKAAPYWDLTLDSPGGRYWRKNKAITSPDYFGSIDGVEKLNWVMADGFEAYHLIPTFYENEAPAGMRNASSTMAYIAKYIDAAPNNLMRGPTVSPTPNRGLTRYPAYELLEGGKTYQYFKDNRLPGSNIATVFGTAMVASLPKRKTISFNFTKEDWDACHDIAKVPGWQNWTLCADFSTIPGFYPVIATDTWPTTVFKKHQLLHTIWHTILGSFSPDNCNTTCLSGDAGDGGFSPNEIFSFFVHHANLDRSAMTWQMNAAMADPKMALNDTLWGYPKSLAEYPLGWDGIFLHDVVNSNFPFTQLGDGPIIPAGYTHADVLHFTNPLGDMVPYTYDTLLS